VYPEKEYKEVEEKACKIQEEKKKRTYTINTCKEVKVAYKNQEEKEE